VPIDDVVISQESRTLSSLVRKESRLLLRAALARLPDKQRMTVMLRVQEGRKFTEIAEIMQCSLGTAKANYHHGGQKLKISMKEQYGEKENPEEATTAPGSQDMKGE